MKLALRLFAQKLPRRDELWRWFLRAIGLVVAVAVLFVGLDAAATHAFAGNSDGATVVLEGAALRHGHLLLSGWDLSFDSFWAIDAIVYAITVGIVGVRPRLTDRRAVTRRIRRDASVVIAWERAIQKWQHLVPWE